MKYNFSLILVLILLGCSKKTQPTQAVRDSPERSEVALEPLLIVDDTVFVGALSDIDSSDIASLEILEDTVASKSKFGEEARHGAVVVFTKSYLSYLDSIANHVDSLKLIFIGDVMGHQGQINSAYDAGSKSYDYEPVFAQMSPLFQQADFSIANLEVTLAGPPYSGYPEFSSPDALAVALKNSGVDAFMTANNHSCDLGGPGILRTVRVLDSLQVLHTGTFRDSLDRDTTNLLILEQNRIRVGLLNYTYGTNYLPNPPPTLVNRIDTCLMRADIQKAKSANLDELIVFMHWGKEYQQEPSVDQVQLASFLFKEGVDIIIGSHPHVLQKMNWIRTSDSTENLVVYSLGNFVSDQRKHPRDGGTIFELTLHKQGSLTRIADAGYYLTWVHKYRKGGKSHYEVLPAASYLGSARLNEYAQKKMKAFVKSSRDTLAVGNVGVKEKIYVLPDESASADK